MPTFLSENLNEAEDVSEGATTLTGYDLHASGTETRYVGFKDGDSVVRLIAVPPGKRAALSGLSLKFSKGLSVESLTGDGKLTANVDYEQEEDEQDDMGESDLVQ